MAENDLEVVQEGNRWLHGPPAGDDVKTWFTNQHLHDGMEHDRYLGGIVLIPGTEKLKVTRKKQNDDLYVTEMDQVAYTPYVKVDTRIDYFWDYVRVLNDGEFAGKFVGVIERVEQAKINDPSNAYYNGNLPKGFFVYPVKNRDNSVNRYVGCEVRVGIYERESLRTIKGHEAVPIVGGMGVKQTLMSKAWADDSALMKVETGAVGRALGVAGILVIGTGVATAEDVQEDRAAVPGQGAGPEAAVLPAGAPEAAGVPATGVAAPAPEAAQEEAAAEPSDEDLRAEAVRLKNDLEANHPEAAAAYMRWYTEEREFGPLADLAGPALKGAVRKLQQDLAAAQEATR